jgi:hypothetical protein
MLVAMIVVRLKNIEIYFLKDDPHNA